MKTTEELLKRLYSESKNFTLDETIRIFDHFGLTAIKHKRPIDFYAEEILFYPMSNLKTGVFISVSGYAIEVIPFETEAQAINFFGPLEIIMPASPQNIVYCLTDMTVFELTKSDIFKMLKSSAVFRKLFAFLKDNHVLNMVDYHMDLHFLPPIQRFYRLAEEKSWVFKHVQPEAIASYLHIPLAEYKKYTQVS